MKDLTYTAMNTLLYYHETVVVYVCTGDILDHHLHFQILEEHGGKREGAVTK